MESFTKPKKGHVGGQWDSKIFRKSISRSDHLDERQDGRPNDL